MIVLPAIKLLTKAIKRLSVEELEVSMSELIAGLFKGYRHTAAEVRKAVVFALVEVHMLSPGILEPYLRLVQLFHLAPI